MAVQAQGKIPMYLVYLLGCALVVLGSVLYKEEMFASSVVVIEHPTHAVVHMHYNEEFRRDVAEMSERHRVGAYKADVLPEDLEDDQYIGELEEDDDGSYSEEWQDNVDNTELFPDDDDGVYPDGMDSEKENTKDPKWIGRHGITDDDEWLGEDVEDEIDPDYSNMDLFDDPEDDGPGAGPQGEEIAQEASGGEKDDSHQGDASTRATDSGEDSDT
mmetsp:Transcript_26792/g.42913  ORF Transcript_26792/g.42913 Transcript_26792/m.42913 type:complete len:216 (+) Transcript_26792:211-858(+)